MALIHALPARPRRNHQPPATSRGAQRSRPAFTLIELLVVVAIIGLLVSILLPTLSSARQQAQGTKCLAQLRVFGQGFSIYINDYVDILPPGRLPKVDNCNTWADINGGRKFRPTFAAMMSTAVGAPPFEDPMPCKDQTDMFGEPGDRQNYSYAVYVCPTVSTWTDERNGSYGYNYQFLGNSRLRDESDLKSYKNWPVPLSWIRQPGRTIAAADCMGTAATLPPAERWPYANNTKDYERMGDEGFNLDPPWVDGENGEMASADVPARTAVDPRHRKRANVVWLDGHADAHLPDELGYRYNPDGSFSFGDEHSDNSSWSGNGSNVPWTYDFVP